ncbi:NAD(P)H-dependent oxidoreductase [Chitinophaga agrisoli]|uniref:NAD(P)H-dependent oxidoreductase n=1 Tax=Chitinophaga agrisoli TaxID=2607653 RepID=A0A5B2VUG8_9BACT|nr:NADPH-dependent FMN reductase [Chitinophaga agrisoli]KAA2242881.1 NAD(P)H-dependent oxidoreductase [Chitinophaga agrisoli]
MNVLIFNGSMDDRPVSTAGKLVGYFEDQFRQKGFTPQVFSPAKADIPFFDPAKNETPASVKAMCEMFCNAELQVWLTPLYHGSMTGVMKNCLDWLELTSRHGRPYLTGKVVALVCWAGGTQAMQGINAMDAVAKALRAWVLPFSIPVLKDHLFDADTSNFTAPYEQKLGQMVTLLADAKSRVA